MLLKKILGKSLKDTKFENLEVKGISRDSRTCQNGEIYFNLTNDENQAKARADEAIKNGASLVVSNFNLPYESSLKVPHVRDTFSKACANFYDRACDDLKIIGVTGTNGKTTTTHVISQMLQRNGKKVGVIGTSGVFYNGKHFDCDMTTPDADYLHKTFKEMRDDGVEYVVMEVSAHAIDQKRINGIKFDYGILTNITQDHLDYFKDMKHYAQTKLKFFNSRYIKNAIVNADDKLQSCLLEKCDVPVISYGLYSPSDVFATNIFCDINGSRFLANVTDSVLDIKTNLIGNYNVYNCLASLAVCKELGLSDEGLAKGLNFINPIEGRFSVAKLDDKYIIIDYAHTPDGLQNVLKTARSLTYNNVFVVFGCGGDRDRDKRHKMGEIAEIYSDMVCLTDDNPRTEKSEDIIADIEKGMNKRHFVEKDRAKAIRKMINYARSGDIIVIAGKGAEKYQEVGTTKIPYNDFDVVYNIFKESDPCRMCGRNFL